MRFSRALPPALLLCLLLVSSCGRPAIVLPKGDQAVTGVLEPASLSASRRGTHFLNQDGRPLTYVESTTVNLRSYENQLVTLRGHFEQNTDPSLLPVLVTTSVTSAVDPTLQPWVMDSIGLRFSAPRDWGAKIDDGFGTFTASGSTQPLLVVFLQRFDDSVFTDRPSTSTQSSRSTLLLGGRRAARITDTVTGGETLLVDRGVSPTVPSQRRVVTFAFTPPLSLDPETALGVFRRIEATILFTDIASSSSSSWQSFSSSPSSGTGSSNGGGQPCGGTAGVLCPSGFYCAITDTTANVGRCQKI